MNEERKILVDMVDQVFADIMSEGMIEQGTDKANAAWQQLVSLSIAELFLPEDKGGFDGQWQDAFEIFRLAGHHAIPLPVCEMMVAKKIVLDAGLAMPDGTLTLGLGRDLQLFQDSGNAGWRCSGTVTAPWGRMADHVLTASEQGDHFLLLSVADCQRLEHALNIAGEPRDQLYFERAPVLACAERPNASETLFRCGALMRTAQIAGALETTLIMSAQYLSERSQFGRPLKKFQVLQHQLALLAEEAAAVKCAAASSACQADSDTAVFEIAAAKLRANSATSQATTIAHQLHGAIGFTIEHRLHYFTQRLWSWRSEFGNDRYWASYLGRTAIQLGTSKFWPSLTARSDQALAN